VSTEVSCHLGSLLTRCIYLFVLSGPGGSQFQINLAEVFGLCKLIKEVVDLGNRVPISDCDFIQSPVINTESLGSIFLLYQYDWAPTR
jgi:hypothetical protein